MAGMQELAEHIIHVAHSANIPVTNLQVQKVAFFSLGMHIRHTGSIDQLAHDTYDIPFEKWQYGPVVEPIYYRLNRFGSKPITEAGIFSPDYVEWDQLIIHLLNINIFDLVNLSHRLPSWANYRQQILNRDYVRSYTIEEIEEDFLND